MPATPGCYAGPARTRLPARLPLAHVHCCFTKDFLDQRLETRLVAHAVVDLVNLKIPTSAVLLLVRFFQPIQTFFFLAKSKIDRRERCRTDVLSFRQLLEFAQ